MVRRMVERASVLFFRVASRERGGEWWTRPIEEGNDEVEFDVSGATGGEQLSR